MARTIDDRVERLEDNQAALGDLAKSTAQRMADVVLPNLEISDQQEDEIEALRLEIVESKAFVRGAVWVFGAIVAGLGIYIAWLSMKGV